MEMLFCLEPPCCFRVEETRGRVGILFRLLPTGFLDTEINSYFVDFSTAKMYVHAEFSLIYALLWLFATAIHTYSRGGNSRQNNRRGIAISASWKVM